MNMKQQGIKQDLAKVTKSMRARTTVLARSRLQTRPFSVGLALVLCLALLIVGCTPAIEDAVAETTQDDSDAGEESSEVLNADAEVIANGTKSEEELTEERIALAIADGTYTDERVYAYHSGTERIVISITLEDEIVTDASIIGIDSHPTSDRFIRGVHSALPELVVGKHISEVELPIGESSVSGSSLTTAAFNEYIAELRDTA